MGSRRLPEQIAMEPTPGGEAMIAPSCKYGRVLNAVNEPDTAVNAFGGSSTATIKPTSEIEANGCMMLSECPALREVDQ